MKIDLHSTEEGSVGQYTNNLYQDILKSDGYRDKWYSKLDRWYRKRYGIRPAKNFPWPNCANLHIPLTDKVIRKLKPKFCRLILMRRPVCRFRPLNNKAEVWFDWLLRTKMSIFKPIVLLVDRMLEKGISISKQIWSYRVERYEETINLEKLPPLDIEQLKISDNAKLTNMLVQMYPQIDWKLKNNYEKIPKFITDFRNGKLVFTDYFDKLIENNPKLIPRKPEEIVVPEDTEDIGEARWITDKAIWMTETDLRLNVEIGKFDKTNVEELISHGTENKTKDDKSIDQTMRSREGIEEVGETTLYNIYETCAWADINDDGIDERVIINFSPSMPNKPLRFRKYPYKHSKWNYVALPLEYNDERYLSPRGIPEILDHLQTEITSQHNQKLDRQTILNAPMYKYLIGAVNMSNVRYIPGQGIGLTRMDAVAPMENPGVGNATEFSYEKEEQWLKTWGEEYIGIPDFSLNKPGAPGEARTAYEVSTVMQEQQNIFSLDAVLFLMGIQEIFTQVYSLYEQYGEKEIVIKQTNSAEPIVIKKEEIMGDYELVPTELDAILHAFNMQALFMKYTNHPMINQYNLVKLDISYTDPFLLDLLLLPEEQAQKNMQQAMMAKEGKGMPQPTNQQAIPTPPTQGG